MKILRCFIENFGVLSKQSIDFDEGLNCIYKGNSSGKTTLFVFIKAMLWGLEATTRRSLDENERNKYRPWNGGRFGGWLEFYSESKGRSYRVTRFFGEKESLDTFEVIDLATSLDAVADFESQSIGASLLAIDADGFERTLFLSERNLEIKNSASITQKISALASGDDESYESAIKILDNKRKFYKNNQGRGLITDLEEKLRQRNAELEDLLVKSDNAKHLENELKDQRQKLENIVKKGSELEQNAEKLSQALIYKTKSASFKALSDRHSELESLTKTIGARYKSSSVSTKDAELVKGKIENVKRLLAQNEYTNQNDLSEQINAIIGKFSADIPQKDDVLELLQGYLQIKGVDIESLRAQKDDALSRYEECKATLPKDPFDENGFEKAQNIKAKINDLGDKKSALADKYLQMSRQKENKADKKMIQTLGIALISVVFGMLAMFLTPWLWIAFGAGIVVSAFEALKLSKQQTQNKQKENEKQALDLEIQEISHTLEELEAEYEIWGARYNSNVKERIQRCTELKNAYDQLYKKYDSERSRIDLVLENIDKKLSIWGITPCCNVEAQLMSISNDLEKLELLKASHKNAMDQQDQLVKQTAIAEDELWDSIDSLICQKTEQRDIESAEQAYNMMLLDASSWPKYQSEMKELEKALAEQSLYVDNEQTDSAYTEKTQEQLKSEIDALKAEISDLDEHKQQLQSLIPRAEAALESLFDRIDDIPIVEQEIDELGSALKSASEEFLTVTKTMEYLEKAKNSLVSRYLGAIKDNFEGVFFKIMGEQSDDTRLDAKLGLKLEREGSLRDIQYFSRGIREIVDFSLRIALIKTLFGSGERPIIMLDDPFASLDGNHLEIAKKCVGEIAGEYQIIYTVCSAERKI